MPDLKTWTIRLVTVLVAAGLYALAALVLKDTSAYEPVLLLAGGVVGLLMPQLGKTVAAALLFTLCMNTTACSSVKPYVATVNDAAALLCQSSPDTQRAAQARGVSVADLCAIHGVLEPFIDEAMRAQGRAQRRAARAMVRP